MQEFSRIDKINEQLLQQISIIKQKMHDIRVQEITILKVMSSKDLSKAKVFFSTLNEDNVVEIEKALNRAASFFRSELANTTKMRKVPMLRFIFDPCLLEGQKLHLLISKLNQGKAEQ